jgi:hypothetical protein
MVHSFLLSEFSSRDVTMVKVATRGGGKRDHPLPPSKRLRVVFDYCSRIKLLLIFGCDASAQYTVYGSMDISP